MFYDSKEYSIWSMGKMSKHKYGELEGKPINFHCELTDEETPIRFENTYLLTACQWDKIEKSPKE